MAFITITGGEANDLPPDGGMGDRRRVSWVRQYSPPASRRIHAVAQLKSLEHTLKRIISLHAATRIGGLSAWRSHAGVAEQAANTVARSVNEAVTAGEVQYAVEAPT